MRSLQFLLRNRDNFISTKFRYTKASYSPTIVGRSFEAPSRPDESGKIFAAQTRRHGPSEASFAAETVNKSVRSNEDETGLNGLLLWF